MTAPVQADAIAPSTEIPVPLHRFVLAWTVMVGGLVGFWCIRSFLETSAFNYGLLAVLLLTWKVASLLCLPKRVWPRFTLLRFLAYCLFIGMQPKQFLVGQRTAAGAPIPTFVSIVKNAISGAVLLWLVPRFLPAATPWALRIGIALVGFSLLFLF